MADEKLLNDLAALANGNLNMNDYANNMLSVLRQSVQQTYLDKFTSIMEEYKEKTRHSLSNEMRLLEAMKPFFQQENESQIKAISEMYNQLYAMQALFSDIAGYKESTQLKRGQRSTLVNEDGVYEMDNSSLPSNANPMNPMLLLLMLMSGF